MSPVFFTDRDLGKRFPEILAAAGLTVERHDALFPPDCRDEEWLAYVGQSGRIAISHDLRIRYRPNERAALVHHRVGLLVVVGKAPLKELAENFVLTMPRIAAFLSNRKAPFIAKVYRPSRSEVAENSNSPGSITLWYPR